jgi:hypothetical protein
MKSHAGETAPQADQIDERWVRIRRPTIVTAAN